MTYNHVYQNCWVHNASGITVQGIIQGEKNEHEHESFRGKFAARRGVNARRMFFFAA